MGFLTPAAQGEFAVAANFVRNQFAQLRNSTEALPEDAWHRRSTVSDFTPASLIDHVGTVAANYGVGIESAVGTAGPGYGREVTEGHADSVEDLSGAELLTAFDERVAQFEGVLARIESGEIPLDAAVPVPPAPWFPPELTHWEVRWVLWHVATEVARHAGHADIIRESIDGKGSYELNALADGETWGEYTAGRA